MEYFNLFAIIVERVNLLKGNVFSLKRLKIMYTVESYGKSVPFSSALICRLYDKILIYHMPLSFFLYIWLCLFVSFSEVMNMYTYKD